MTATDDRVVEEAARTPEFWWRYVYDEARGADEGAFQVTMPGHGWSVELNLDFESGLHDLGLRSESAPAARHELGHWDEARWHPFCLRWTEVEAVAQAVQADPRPLTFEVALLLLVPWVGHGGDEVDALAAHRTVVATQLLRLGVFDGDEATEVAERLLADPPDEDYAWRRDDVRGWTFGGEYPCYSNRNGSHDFPFAQFRAFRQQLGLGASQTS